MSGTKLDDSKARPDLLPPLALHLVSLVQTFGCLKYGEGDWKNVPDGIKRYYAALKRHLAEFDMGEDFDEETGLSHLAHAACNLLFVLELMGKGTPKNLIDLDRFGLRGKGESIPHQECDKVLIEHWKQSNELLKAIRQEGKQ